MKIVRIAKQEKRDRYNLFGPSGFVGAVSAVVLAESGLREGDELDPGKLDELQQRDTYGKALAKAYDYLSRRPHARAELQKKLDAKDFDPELTGQVLDHLEDLGYVNDEEFARRWVMLRGASRGPTLLRQELRRKGLDDTLIDRVLVEHREEHDDLTEAETLARKRYATMTDVPWEKVYARLTGYLGRRGYDYDVIRTVVDRIKAER